MYLRMLVVAAWQWWTLACRDTRQVTSSFSGEGTTLENVGKGNHDDDDDTTRVAHTQCTGGQRSLPLAQRLSKPDVVEEEDHWQEDFASCK